MRVSSSSSSSSSLKEHPSGLQQKESMNSRQQFVSCEEQQEDGGGHFFSGFPDLNPVFSAGQQQLQMAELNAFVSCSGGSSSSPPRALSSIMGNRALSGLVQKIGHLQMLVQLVGEGRNGNQQQQLATAAGIGRLIDQLLVAAKGILLEQQQAVQQHHLLGSSTSCSNQFSAATGLFQEGILGACSGNNNNSSSSFVGDFIGDDSSFQQMPFHGILPKTEDEEQLPWMPILAEAQKHEDGDDEAAENLPQGAYDLVELDAMEIMAEHTHFCEICGKGFKRDANLRMHMRGHGDEYKTAAALARPREQQQQQKLAAPPKRYSCPYAGCKRNKQHRKFVPLKTMLCVKNHYRRSHCPKRLACTKCRVKRFAVLADLKTHEKHCGRDKWQCSCGTTFSRKDKLLGHVALFLGHKPLVMLVPPPPPPPVLVLPGGDSAAYAQNGHLVPKAFLAQHEVAYYMGNFHAAGGNISNNNSSTVMLVGGGRGGSSGGSSSALTTTTEVGMDAATTTVERCWSPSIFTSPPTAINNNNSNNQQESNSNNINNYSLSSSSSFVGLDFFDCKS